MSLSFVLGAFHMKWWDVIVHSITPSRRFRLEDDPVAQCQLKEVQFSQLSSSFVQVAFFFGEVTWVTIKTRYIYDMQGHDSLSWHLPLLKAAAASYGILNDFLLEVGSGVATQ